MYPLQAMPNLRGCLCEVDTKRPAIVFINSNEMIRFERMQETGKFLNCWKRKYLYRNERKSRRFHHKLQCKRVSPLVAYNIHLLRVIMCKLQLRKVAMKCVDWCAQRMLNERSWKRSNKKEARKLTVKSTRTKFSCQTFWRQESHHDTVGDIRQEDGCQHYEEDRTGRGQNEAAGQNFPRRL